MKNTILTNFLNALGVKHTKMFSNEFYRNHPYKNTLFGLSRMLSSYNISAIGVDVKNKNILNIDLPCIAHTTDGFIIVKKIIHNKIYYEFQGKVLILEQNDFEKMWSGILLLAETCDKSIEPDYLKHFWSELWSKIKKSLLLCMIFFVFLCLSYNIKNSYREFVLLLMNLIGVVLCCLLFLKQNKLTTEFADKICSLFHQKDCNNVLQSSGANIFGFSLTQVGLGYFISNIVLIVFYPYLMFYLFIINILTLFFTFWSVWYQYKILNSWCLLCIFVQILLWSIFVANLIFGYKFNLFLNIKDLVYVVVIYLFPILLLDFLFDISIKAGQFTSVKTELINLKSKNEVFEALLKKEPHCWIDTQASQIIFGNRFAKIGITIVSNPHCRPCSKMHKRIVSILKEAGDKLYVQYIFCSFSDKLINSNKYLIAAYQQKSLEEAELIYNYWFDNVKYNISDLLKETNINIDNDDVNIELNKHLNWLNQSNITSTPTILINGYRLPDVYKVEDIMDFVDLYIV